MIGRSIGLLSAGRFAAKHSSTQPEEARLRSLALSVLYSGAMYWIVGSPGSNPDGGNAAWLSVILWSVVISIIFVVGIVASHGLSLLSQPGLLLFAFAASLAIHLALFRLIL